MNEEDLDYLEELAKEPEKSKLDKVISEDFADEDSKKEYKDFLNENHIDVKDDVEEEDEELKNLDVSSLFDSEEAEDEFNLFDEESSEEKKEPVTEEVKDEFEEKFSKQKELRKELDELYKNTKIDRVIEDEPELLDVSEEGLEQYKKDLMEFMRQDSIRKEIDKKSKELIELDSQNGNYDQAKFNLKIKNVFEGAEKISKTFKDDFEKFGKDIIEFAKEQSSKDSKFAERISKFDNMILDDENASDLMAYFTKKPEEYKKLLSMSDIDAARVLSANSTKISLKKQTLNKSKDIKVSQPLNTNVQSKTTFTKVKNVKDLHNMSDDDFDKMLLKNWDSIKSNF